MMEQYGYTYDVQPPGPPVDKNPILMVGWREDPATVPENQAALRRPIPFSEYVDKGLAVYIDPNFKAIETSYSQWLNRSAVVMKIPL